MISNNYEEILKNCIQKEILPYINFLETDRDLIKIIYKILGNYNIFDVFFDSKNMVMIHNKKLFYILFKELSYLNTSILSLSIATHLIATNIFLKYASDELKYKYMKKIISGETIMAIALSEINAGSNLSNISTTYKDMKNGFIINGEKQKITNAFCADIYLILARNEKKYTLFCVDNIESINKKVIDSLGNQGILGEIKLNNHFVNKNSLLSSEGSGFLIQMVQFQHERIIIALRLIHQSRYILVETESFMKNRMTFSKKLINNQYLQFQLAILFTELEAAESFWDYSYEYYLEKKDITIRASMAKYYLTQLSRKIANFCLQIFASKGYCDDSFIGKFYLDQRGLAIAGGTDEMMLNIIGNYIKKGKI
jgi:citronellyl-CoA dehydrogenase